MLFYLISLVIPIRIKTCKSIFRNVSYSSLTDNRQYVLDIILIELPYVECKHVLIDVHL